MAKLRTEEYGGGKFKKHYLTGGKGAGKRKAKLKGKILAPKQVDIIIPVSVGCPPKFPIEVCGKKICTYIADFMYHENGNKIIEDVKGVKTSVYRIKKKLTEAIYDITIKEV